MTVLNGHSSFHMQGRGLLPIDPLPNNAYPAHVIGLRSGGEWGRAIGGLYAHRHSSRRR